MADGIYVVCDIFIIDAFFASLPVFEKFWSVKEI